MSRKCSRTPVIHTRHDSQTSCRAAWSFISVLPHNQWTCKCLDCQIIRNVYAQIKSDQPSEIFTPSYGYCFCSKLSTCVFLIIGLDCTNSADHLRYKRLSWFTKKHTASRVFPEQNELKLSLQDHNHSHLHEGIYCPYTLGGIATSLDQKYRRWHLVLS